MLPERPFVFKLSDLSLELADSFVLALQRTVDFV